MVLVSTRAIQLVEEVYEGVSMTKRSSSSSLHRCGVVGLAALEGWLVLLLGGGETPINRFMPVPCALLGPWLTLTVQEEAGWRPGIGR
jgi:hypothetical protein